MKVCSTVTFAKAKPKSDPASFHKLTYGLFVLTAKGERENGCVVNTAVQVASEPTRISVAVQKENYTRELIEQSGEFNVSVLTEEVPFEVIRHFGMQTGREVDKFADFANTAVATNGVRYINRHTNAFFSAKVVSSADLGSHTLFIGEVTEAQVLGDAPSCTYAHYHAAIKPKR
ncbi:MAG: flavin reductase [Clostridia bacterium]|nr:flavin reductase [Clostridia bacterium]